jgi:ABC-2 type transport system permease protein
MSTIRKLTWTEFKILLRSPMAVGFTVLFPAMLVVIVGLVWGNTPDPKIGGYGGLDALVPAYFALIIVIAGLINLPISLAVRREQGILRRFRATPLRPAVVLGSQVLVSLLLAITGAVLLIAVGRVLFNLRLPADPLGVTLAFVLSGLSFFALSFIVAGLARTSDAARSIGLALYFPMMMLSGAAFPRASMPPAVQEASAWLPMTQVVTLLQGLWLGTGWNRVAVVVLIGMLIAGALIATRTFRWE